MKKPKILIVDDRSENLLVLESLIESPFVELIRATSGNEALAKTLDHDFALVLLDVQMPAMDGYEVAELMRRNSSTRHIPIIFVTANYTEKTQIFKGYDAGAVDYLAKPLEPVILRSKVSVFLELYRQRQELKDKTIELDKRLGELEELKKALEKTNEQLMLLSTMDGLTGLRNRRSFDELFNEEWHRSIRNTQDLAILLIDIDFFKAYNDNYGHLQGDICLKTVARSIAGVAQRHGDKVARYGGEEFVTVLPGTGLVGAEAMAEKIREEVYSLNISHTAAQNGRLTVSIGVAAMLPVKGMDPASLIEAADKLLYDAKAAGRNCWKSGVSE